MVLVTNSWKMWLAGTAASLVIFAVVFFTVIQPSSNTANNAVKAGLQQSQQALNQAQQQISNAGSQAAAAGSQGAAVTGAAQQTMSKAQKLVACMASAGTDVSKVQGCQAKYGG